MFYTTAKRQLILFSLFLIFFASCKKVDTIGNRDYQTLGTSAHDLLASSPYSLLRIELHYMPGYQVDSASIDELKMFLAAYINKPAGIQIFQQQISAIGKSVLTLSDVVSIEKKNRKIFTANDAISVHILITDGNYSNAATFATSYWNTSFCIFGKTINDNSGGFGQVSRTHLTTTILEHEFGHLMGLVDQGSPMQLDHKDAANGAHCNDKNCLMYYDVEAVKNGIVINSIPPLDANCNNDLIANGGK